jgi:hypothetical protein
LAGVCTLIAAFTLVDEPVEAAVAGLETALGSDYLLTASLGTVALAFAALALLSGTAAPRQATMPEVEGPTPVPAPGEEFDRSLTGWRGSPIVASAARDDVRRRLRRVAIQVVAATDGCSRETAKRRVDEGTWTDDQLAAQFLDSNTGRPPLTERLTALRHGETWLQYHTRQTVDVLVERDEGSQQG